MPEAEATPGDPAATPTPNPADDLGDAGKKALDDERAARREADRARKALEKELDELRKTNMSDTEKAIATARAEARAEALAESGAKVAASELRAAARLAGFGDEQASTLIAGLNLASFLDADGDVDPTLVAQFIDGITPKPPESPTPAPLLDLGQGARTAAMALNGDPLLRSVKEKLGI